MTFEEFWAVVILPTLDGYSTEAVRQFRQVAEKAWRGGQKYAGRKA